MNTLAFGYVLPTTGRTPDLHRLETCAAGRTITKGSADLLFQKVSRAFFALNIGLDAIANLQTIRSPK